MITFALIAALLGTAPTGFTSTAERVLLTRTNAKPPSLTVEPLPGRLVLSNVRPKSPRSSTLCPQVETQGDRTVMQCTTRRLWAEVTVEEGGTYLDIRLLMGLPWGESWRCRCGPGPSAPTGSPTSALAAST